MGGGNGKHICSTHLPPGEKVANRLIALGGNFRPTPCTSPESVLKLVEEVQACLERPIKGLAEGLHLDESEFSEWLAAGRQLIEEHFSKMDLKAVQSDADRFCRLHNIPQLDDNTEATIGRLRKSFVFAPMDKVIISVVILCSNAYIGHVRTFLEGTNGEGQRCFEPQPPGSRAALVLAAIKACEAVGIAPGPPGYKAPRIMGKHHPQRGQLVITEQNAEEWDLLIAPIKASTRRRAPTA